MRHKRKPREEKPAAISCLRSQGYQPMCLLRSTFQNFPGFAVYVVSRLLVCLVGWMGARTSVSSSQKLKSQVNFYTWCEVRVEILFSHPPTPPPPMDVHLFHCHLWKRLTFSHWITLALCQKSIDGCNFILGNISMIIVLNVPLYCFIFVFQTF